MTTDERSPALADALTLLGRRDFTRSALVARLEAKGHGPAEIDNACRRCIEYGYLDDHAYGVVRATRRLGERPCSELAIVQDLRRQGLTRTMSEQVAAEVIADAGGEDAVLDAALRAWLDRHGEPPDWRTAKRCADHLARRGFRPAAVRAKLSPWLDELSD